MRTSRISQETHRIISATTLSSSPRQSTRATLARFAHNGDLTKQEHVSEGSEDALDMEDVVPSKKRKRDAATLKRSPRKVTIKTETEDSVTLSPSKDRKVRKPAHKVKNSETGEVEIHPPNDWNEVYAAVKEMRTKGAAQNAAVDTMGCERLADEHVSEKDKRYHTLTALMLSSQTKDTTNAVAMKRLKTELPAHKKGATVGLNLENILAVDPKLLNELIWVVGFHNNKTRYIKATAEILRDEWNGDIPDNVEGLMSLPGVGPKMAYLCLSSAWGKTEGIGVDVHVHRITNLWGWHKTKGPEETRIALQAWLPRELWHEINWLLVGFGQTICLPVGRRCGECTLGLNSLCKSAERSKVTLGRKTRGEKIKQDDEGNVLETTETVKVEEVTEDVPMNADAESEVVTNGMPNLPTDQGLSREEEKTVLEDIENSPGTLKKSGPRPLKR